MNKRHVTMDEILASVLLYLESKGLKVNGKFKYGFKNLTSASWEDVYLHIESDHFKECEPVSINSLIKEVKDLKDKLNAKKNIDIARSIVSRDGGVMNESIVLGINMSNLKSIIQSTISMSDVFFEHPVEVRKLILKELDKLE